MQPSIPTQLPSTTSPDDFEDDLVFPSELKQSNTVITVPIEPEKEETVANPEESPKLPSAEIVETDGSRFILMTPNVEQEYSGYRCEACGKTLQRGNIKKHIATKTHKDKLVPK